MSEEPMYTLHFPVDTLTRSHVCVDVKGYLTDKKMHPLRTLQ